MKINQRPGNELPEEISFELFKSLSESVAESLDRLKQSEGESLWLKLIETFGDEAVDLVSKLKLIASIPRHQHGETHNHYDRSDNRKHYYEKNERRYDHYYEQHTEHKIEVHNSNDRLYRVGPDLIISTSGQFAFRPKSRQLSIGIGTFELSETEAICLHERLKYDYRL